MPPHTLTVGVVGRPTVDTATHARVEAVGRGKAHSTVAVASVVTSSIAIAVTPVLAEGGNCHAHLVNAHLWGVRGVSTRRDSDQCEGTVGVTLEGVFYGKKVSEFRM